VTRTAPSISHRKFIFVDAPGTVGTRRYFERRMMTERKGHWHFVVAFGAVTVHIFH
jgi:hypothetical protein